MGRKRSDSEKIKISQELQKKREQQKQMHD